MSGIDSQPGAGSAPTKQQYGLLIAGGIAVGLGFAGIWYTRRKNLARKSRPTKIEELTLTKGPPDSGGPYASSKRSESQGHEGTSGNGVQRQGSSPQQKNANGSDGNFSNEGNTQQRQENLLHADQGNLPTYGWIQNGEEAYLMTTCASDVRSKEVKCQIQPTSIKLSVRGDIVLEGTFYKPVNVSESVWELEPMKEDRKRLTVTLVKAACSSDWPTLVKDKFMAPLNAIVA